MLINRFFLVTTPEIYLVILNGAMIHIANHCEVEVSS